jgi:acyl-CoA hydrolase
LGSKKLYEFVDKNPVIEMLPVEYVNNPITIAKEDNMVAINATTEVDFYGQCASETVAGKYYSSSGGQADFGTGVQLAENGKGFICLYSTAKNGEVSRIRPTLAPGSVVTTSKNDVDFVVTEYGIVQLKNKSISERTKSLISIAHPNFREELMFEAKKMGMTI